MRAVNTGKLDDKTKQELIKQNRCFYCREVGHRAAKCPAKPHKDPKTRAVEEDDNRIEEVEEDTESDIGLNAISMDIGQDF